MHTVSQQQESESTLQGLRKEGTWVSFGLESICSSYAPNMQHEFIRERLEGLDDEEGEWAEF